MNKPARAVVAWLGLVVFLVGSRAGWGAPNYDQSRKAQAADRVLLNAGNLFKAGKYEEAAELVRRSQKFVGEVYLAGDRAEAEKLTTGLRTRLEKARQLLAAKNVTVEELKIPEPKPETPPPDKTKSGKPDKPAAHAATISFTRQVAPLLVSKCGRCHIADSKGKVSMASFDALMRGGKKGPIIVPGKSAGSRIVRMIASGEMPPRKSAPVTREELAVLARWIDEGAKFDGANTAARLADAAPAGRPAGEDSNAVAVAAAGGNEKVLFSRDIAPILADNCTSCHGGQRPRAGLSMAQFAALTRGGDSGAPLAPGKPAESLLVQKLNGTAAEGKRMPLDRPPLADDKIALVATWIREGAKFDGPDPAQPLDDLIAASFARRATHEQLTARRAQIARQKWRLSNPDRQPQTLETKDFQIYTLATDHALQEIGQRAEAQAGKVAALLRAPADRPLLKGRQTLYVFQKRYNYSEFGQMVEKRELPEAQQGHWFFSRLDAYGCVLLPHDEKQLDALLAEQIAGAYLASLGDVPAWFSHGSARAVAARLALRDDRVIEWDEQLPAALRSQSQPDDFLIGKLAPEQANLISYGFAAELLKRNASYQRLLHDLRAGKPFAPAFAVAYGAAPQEFAANWAPRAARRR